MTSYLSHNDTHNAALLFHRLCPGDWIRGRNVGLSGQFMDFIDQLPDAPPASDIDATVRFRWDICLRADKFIGLHNLQLSNGQICAMWNMYEDARWTWDEDMKRRHGIVWQVLNGPEGEIWPKWLRQGPCFTRPLTYVTLAIARSFTGKEDLERVAREYLEYLEGVRGEIGIRVPRYDERGEYVDVEDGYGYEREVVEDEEEEEEEEGDGKDGKDSED